MLILLLTIGIIVIIAVIVTFFLLKKKKGDKSDRINGLVHEIQEAQQRLTTCEAENEKIRTEINVIEKDHADTLVDIENVLGENGMFKEDILISVVNMYNSIPPSIAEILHEEFDLVSLDNYASSLSENESIAGYYDFMISALNKFLKHLNDAIDKETCEGTTAELKRQKKAAEDKLNSDKNYLQTHQGYHTNFVNDKNQTDQNIVQLQSILNTNQSSISWFNANS